MQNIALSWLVYRLTHSEVMLGATTFCTHVPVLLLGPLAGLVADRYPRRRIVIVTQSLFLAHALVLTALTATGVITVGGILALAVVQGIINAFDVPARQSMLIELTGPTDLLNAVSLNSAIFNAARVIGPSLGGIIVAVYGEAVCFGVNAASFLAVILSLTLLKLTPAAAPPLGSQFNRLMDGFRFVWRTPGLRALMGVSAAVNLALAPMLVLFPFFSEDIFQMGSRGVGFLSGALGAGAIAGTLGLAARTGTRGLKRLIWTGTLLLGIALAVYSWSPQFWISMLLMPVIGFHLMRQNAATNTQVQTTISEDYRGRVMGIYSMTVIGMFPVGGLLAGWMAAVYGARWTVFAGGLACVVAALFFRGLARKVAAV